MRQDKNIAYYRDREARERELAEAASHPNVIRVHRELAARYQSRIAATLPPHRS